jgi:hypothetical protein
VGGQGLQSIFNRAHVVLLAHVICFFLFGLLILPFAFRSCM